MLHVFSLSLAFFTLGDLCEKCFRTACFVHESFTLNSVNCLKCIQQCHSSQTTKTFRLLHNDFVSVPSLSAIADATFRLHAGARSGWNKLPKPEKLFCVVWFAGLSEQSQSFNCGKKAPSFIGMTASWRRFLSGKTYISLKKAKIK